MARLDSELVARGLCPSREKAKRAIIAGLVRINGQTAHKPSDVVASHQAVTIDSTEKFVSRGGFKLEHALEAFRLNVAGLTALDIGASTGGFTDCLLQRGVIRVFAVDVGHGQLAWKLRCDPRVIAMERVNARYLDPGAFPRPFEPVDLVVIDCSFISLRMILLPAIAFLRAEGRIVALVKPQFEAGKLETDKGGGVITDPAVHARILLELREFVSNRTKLEWRAQTESPLLGPAGNKEFLILLEKTE